MNKVFKIKASYTRLRLIGGSYLFVLGLFFLQDVMQVVIWVRILGILTIGVSATGLIAAVLYCNDYVQVTDTSLTFKTGRKIESYSWDTIEDYHIVVDGNDNTQQNVFLIIKVNGKIIQHGLSYYKDCENLRQIIENYLGPQNVLLSKTTYKPNKWQINNRLEVRSMVAIIAAIIIGCWLLLIFR